jgi:hypothetical protein
MKLKTIVEDSNENIMNMFLETYKKTFTLGVGNNVITISNSSTGDGPMVYLTILVNDFPINSGSIITDTVKGLCDHMVKNGFSELNPEFYVKSVTINIDNKSNIQLLSLLPTSVRNHIQHGGPNMSEILLGSEDFDFDLNVLPKIDEDLSQWIDIVIKKCNTAYEVLKKGTLKDGLLEGIDYELEMVDIHTSIQWKGGMEPITKKDIHPLLSLRLKTSETLPQGVREHVIDKLTGRFQKMFNISPSIF